MIDRTILWLSRSKLEYRALADRLRVTRARCCSWRSRATPRTRCAPSSTSSKPRGSATATATTSLRAETAAEQAR